MYADRSLVLQSFKHHLLEAEHPENSTAAAEEQNET